MIERLRNDAKSSSLESEPRSMAPATEQLFSATEHSSGRSQRQGLVSMQTEVEFLSLKENLGFQQASSWTACAPSCLLSDLPKVLGWIHNGDLHLMRKHRTVSQAGLSNSCRALRVQIDTDIHDSRVTAMTKAAIRCKSRLFISCHAKQRTHLQA